MFCLSGTERLLTNNLFPPIVLEGEWEIGLVNLCTYNSIPNIEHGVNNLFHYANKVLEIPEGSYEIDDIKRYLHDNGVAVKINANKNTLKCEILFDKVIDFSKPGSIGPLLGFDRVVLKPNVRHHSHNQVDINRVNSIRVECSIARGSYLNGKEGHTIHEFFPKVPPGFKIVEAPPTIIYVPINTNRISSITVQLFDQDGRAINFRGETITVRLHLRRRNGIGI
jgi:hypothetical protein